MTSGAGGRLRELFLAARELAPEQRQAFLQQACPDDPALRAEVLALLGAAPLPDRSVVEVLAEHGAAAAPATAGAQFGRFLLQAHLGAGGMGQVDRAFDPLTQRSVAIKRLRAEWAADPDLVARFAREVQAAGRLAVPGLCPVFETGEIDGVRYCVMPWVQGEPLAERLRATAGKPSSATIREYVALFAKVARALHRAHEAGLVHRDLKPGNLMIQPDGEPMVLDFGLVQDLTLVDQRLTRTDQLPGTPAYMAPEQVRGLPTDRRADVHALGVLLFECICGTRPFTGASPAELFAQIQHLPLPSPRRLHRAVPQSLAVVLAVATEKAPERRYRTAAHLAEDLERVLAGQPVAARRQPLWRRLGHWAQRNRTAAATLFVVAAGLGSASVLQLRRSALLDDLRATIQSEQALRATANELRASAEERLADFDGLAALTRSAQAERAERLLYPPWPERREALQAWLDQYGASLVQDRDQLAATLSRLLRRSEAFAAAAAPPAQVALVLPPLDPKLAALPAAEQVLASKLQQGLATLDQQLGPAGLRQRVQWNLAWARGIADWSTLLPQRRTAWAEAAAAIARADGATASTLYAGTAIRLEPVLGFVPIGMNPATRLWEFYDLRSAFDPRLGGDPADLPIPRHEPDGSLQLGTEHGMVFVLLPGGVAECGAQATDPAGAFYCAQARANEGRSRQDLAPFFLSRYELTQAQWQRLSLAADPSLHRPGTAHVSEQAGGLHPVENVSPHQSEDLLRDFGLRLPSEWEWEYACRAGTTTPWHTGAEPDSLLGFANLADVTLFRAWRKAPEGDFDDGFAVHAPVGSGGGNEFGCYDMHGNIAEPCAEADPTLPTRRVLRGGAWLQNPDFARSAYRSSTGFDERNDYVGVRAARSLH